MALDAIAWAPGIKAHQAKHSSDQDVIGSHLVL